MMSRDRIGSLDGHPTRGKTAQNRLRRIDLYLALMERELLRREDGDFHHAWYVDLGYGSHPFTTLESAARLRRVHPGLCVLGVEIDPERVARAQAYGDDRTVFRQGGFKLPLERNEDAPETVRLIRAMNVLRQYDEEEVLEAYRQMGSNLLPGGLLVEGTSNPTGRIWVVNLLRRAEARSELQFEGILFGTNFRDGFDPVMFQPVLPKAFIHHMTDGDPMDDFFQTWKEAWRETIGISVFGPRQWFIQTARRLAERGFSIDARRKLLSRGMLLLRRSFGIESIPLDQL
ncbi:MAG: hypothetical protein JXA97_13035 [Anaerolineales bacterium]|nr:hypothetical protein [Anaerolineales bacterium]